MAQASLGENVLLTYFMLMENKHVGKTEWEKESSEKI